MSSIMQNVGRVLPLWYVTSLVQDAWLGFGWNVIASLVLAGVIVLAAAVTFLKFRRE
jgi:hypothetical protein